MKVLNRNRVTEIPVNREYVDGNGITWEFRAYVQINSSYEVMGSTITAIDGFDMLGNEVNKDGWLTPDIIDQIKEAAERRALERIESVDFVQEDERE